MHSATLTRGEVVECGCLICCNPWPAIPLLQIDTQLLASLSNSSPHWRGLISKDCGESLSGKQRSSNADHKLLELDPL